MPSLDDMTAIVKAEEALDAAKRKRTRREPIHGIGTNPDDTMVSMDISDRDNISVFSTQTGEEHPVRRVNFGNVMKKKFSNGLYAFWHPNFAERGPRPEKVRGEHKCFLSPKYEEREFIDSLGLKNAFCNGGNPNQPNREDFASSLLRDEHVRVKHPNTWRIVKEAKERQEKAEAREMQRGILGAFEAIAKKLVG